MARSIRSQIVFKVVKLVLRTRQPDENLSSNKKRKQAVTSRSKTEQKQHKLFVFSYEKREARYWNPCRILGNKKGSKNLIKCKTIYTINSVKKYLKWRENGRKIIIIKIEKKIINKKVVKFLKYQVFLFISHNERKIIAGQ